MKFGLLLEYPSGIMVVQKLNGVGRSFENRSFENS